MDNIEGKRMMNKPFDWSDVLHRAKSLKTRINEPFIITLTKIAKRIKIITNQVKIVDVANCAHNYMRKYGGNLDYAIQRSMDIIRNTNEDYIVFVVKTKAFSDHTYNILENYKYNMPSKTSLVVSHLGHMDLDDRKRDTRQWFQNTPHHLVGIDDSTILTLVDIFSYQKMTVTVISNDLYRDWKDLLQHKSFEMKWYWPSSDMDTQDTIDMDEGTEHEGDQSIDYMTAHIKPRLKKLPSYWEERTIRYW